MENTNIVTTEQQAPNTISAGAIFNVPGTGSVAAFANLMADSQVLAVPAPCRKQASYVAIVMQAMQWGMNPYAVARKHTVNGVLFSGF